MNDDINTTIKEIEGVKKQIDAFIGAHEKELDPKIIGQAKDAEKSATATIENAERYEKARSVRDSDPLGEEAINWQRETARKHRETEKRIEFEKQEEAQVYFTQEKLQARAARREADEAIMKEEKEVMDQHRLRRKWRVRQSDDGTDVSSRSRVAREMLGRSDTKLEKGLEATGAEIAEADTKLGELKSLRENRTSLQQERQGLERRQNAIETVKKNKTTIAEIDAELDSYGLIDESRRTTLGQERKKLINQNNGILRKNGIRHEDLEVTESETKTRIKQIDESLGSSAFSSLDERIKDAEKNKKELEVRQGTMKGVQRRREVKKKEEEFSRRNSAALGLDLQATAEKIAEIDTRLANDNRRTALQQERQYLIGRLEAVEAVKQIDGQLNDPAESIDETRRKELISQRNAILRENHIEESEDLGVIERVARERSAEIDTDLESLKEIDEETGEELKPIDEKTRGELKEQRERLKVQQRTIVRAKEKREKAKAVAYEETGELRAQSSPELDAATRRIGEIDEKLAIHGPLTESRADLEQERQELERREEQIDIGNLEATAAEIAEVNAELDSPTPPYGKRRTELEQRRQELELRRDIINRGRVRRAIREIRGKSDDELDKEWHSTHSQLKSNELSEIEREDIKAKQNLIRKEQLRRVRQIPGQNAELDEIGERIGEIDEKLAIHGPLTESRADLEQERQELEKRQRVLEGAADRRTKRITEIGTKLDSDDRRAALREERQNLAKRLDAVGAVRTIDARITEIDEKLATGGPLREVRSVLLQERGKLIDNKNTILIENQIEESEDLGVIKSSTEQKLREIDEKLAIHRPLTDSASLERERRSLKRRQEATERAQETQTARIERFRKEYARNVDAELEERRDELQVGRENETVHQRQVRLDEIEAIDSLLVERKAGQSIKEETEAILGRSDAELEEDLTASTRRIGEIDAIEEGLHVAPLNENELADLEQEREKLEKRQKTIKRIKETRAARKEKFHSEHIGMRDSELEARRDELQVGRENETVHQRQVRLDEIEAIDSLLAERKRIDETRRNRTIIESGAPIPEKSKTHEFLDYYRGLNRDMLRTERDALIEGETSYPAEEIEERLSIANSIFEAREKEGVERNARRAGVMHKESDEYGQEALLRSAGAVDETGILYDEFNRMPENEAQRMVREARESREAREQEAADLEQQALKDPRVSQARVLKHVQDFAKDRHYRGYSYDDWLSIERGIIEDIQSLAASDEEGSEEARTELEEQLLAIRHVKRNSNLRRAEALDRQSTAARQAAREGDSAITARREAEKLREQATRIEEEAVDRIASQDADQLLKEALAVGKIGQTDVSAESVKQNIIDSITWDNITLIEEEEKLVNRLARLEALPTKDDEDIQAVQEELLAVRYLMHNKEIRESIGERDGLEAQAFQITHAEKETNSDILRATELRSQATQLRNEEKERLAGLPPDFAEHHKPGSRTRSDFSIEDLSAHLEDRYSRDDLDTSGSSIYSVAQQEYTKRHEGVTGLDKIKLLKEDLADLRKNDVSGKDIPRRIAVRDLIIEEEAKIRRESTKPEEIGGGDGVGTNGEEARREEHSIPPTDIPLDPVEGKPIVADGIHTEATAAGTESRPDDILSTAKEAAKEQYIEKFSGLVGPLRIERLKEELSGLNKENLPARMALEELISHEETRTANEGPASPNIGSDSALGDNRRLFVKNLPYSATEEDVRSLFEEIGPVQSVEIIKKNGHPTGHGYVTMGTPASTQRAIKDAVQGGLNGMRMFYGTGNTSRRIYVQEYEERRPRSQATSQQAEAPVGRTEHTKSELDKGGLVIYRIAKQAYKRKHSDKTGADRVSSFIQELGELPEDDAPGRVALQELIAEEKARLQTSPEVASGQQTSGGVQAEVLTGVDLSVAQAIKDSDDYQGMPPKKLRDVRRSVSEGSSQDKHIRLRALDDLITERTVKNFESSLMHTFNSKDASAALSSLGRSLGQNDIDEIRRTYPSIKSFRGALTKKGLTISLINQILGTRRSPSKISMAIWPTQPSPERKTRTAGDAGAGAALPDLDTSRKIEIDNLPIDTTEQGLREFLHSKGIEGVESIEFTEIEGRDDSVRLSALLTMGTKEMAQQTQRSIHGKTFGEDNRILTTAMVRPKRTQERRRETPRSADDAGREIQEITLSIAESLFDITGDRIPEEELPGVHIGRVRKELSALLDGDSSSPPAELENSIKDALARYGLFMPDEDINKITYSYGRVRPRQTDRHQNNQQESDLRGFVQEKLVAGTAIKGLQIRTPKQGQRYGFIEFGTQEAAQQFIERFGEGGEEVLTFEGHGLSVQQATGREGEAEEKTKKKVYLGNLPTPDAERETNEIPFSYAASLFGITRDRIPEGELPGVNIGEARRGLSALLGGESSSPPEELERSIKDVLEANHLSMPDEDIKAIASSYGMVTQDQITASVGSIGRDPISDYQELEAILRNPELQSDQNLRNALLDPNFLPDSVINQFKEQHPSIGGFMRDWITKERESFINKNQDRQDDLGGLVDLGAYFDQNEKPKIIDNVDRVIGDSSHLFNRLFEVGQEPRRQSEQEEDELGGLVRDTLGYGSLQEIRIAADRETGRSRGFGFLTFNTAKAAQGFIERFGAEGEEELTVQGRKLTVRKRQQQEGESKRARKRGERTVWVGGLPMSGVIPDAIPITHRQTQSLQPEEKFKELLEDPQILANIKAFVHASEGDNPQLPNSKIARAIFGDRVKALINRQDIDYLNRFISENKEIIESATGTGSLYYTPLQEKRGGAGEEPTTRPSVSHIIEDYQRYRGLEPNFDLTTLRSLESALSTERDNETDDERRIRESDLENIRKAIRKQNTPTATIETPRPQSTQSRLKQLLIEKFGDDARGWSVIVNNKGVGFIKRMNNLDTDKMNTIIESLQREGVGGVRFEQANMSIKSRKSNAVIRNSDSIYLGDIGPLFDRLNPVTSTATTRVDGDGDNDTSRSSVGGSGSAGDTDDSARRTEVPARDATQDSPTPTGPTQVASGREVPTEAPVNEGGDEEIADPTQVAESPGKEIGQETEKPLTPEQLIEVLQGGGLFSGTGGGGEAPAEESGNKGGDEEIAGTKEAEPNQASPQHGEGDAGQMQESNRQHIQALEKYRQISPNNQEIVAEEEYMQKYLATDDDTLPQIVEDIRLILRNQKIELSDIERKNLENEIRALERLIQEREFERRYGDDGDEGIRGVRREDWQ